MSPSFTALQHAGVEGCVTLCTAAIACSIADIMMITAALYINVVTVKFIQWQLSEGMKGRVGKDKERRVMKNKEG